MIKLVIPLGFVLFNLVYLVKAAGKAMGDERFLIGIPFSYLPAFFFLLAFLVGAADALIRFRKKAPLSMRFVLPKIPILFFLTALTGGILFAWTPFHWKYETYLGFSLFMVLCSLLLLVADTKGMRRFFQKPGVRRLEQVLLPGSLVLLIVEIGVSAWSPHSLHPIFVNTGLAPEKVAAHHLKPGQRFFGFPFNSLGFHDAEFQSKGEGKYIVNVVADSFGLGVVPYHQNFTTVAEKTLNQMQKGVKVTVNNFGVPAVTTSEYPYIYEAEASRVPSDLVVFCLFANYIEHLEAEKRKNWWDLPDWVSFQVTRKLVFGQFGRWKKADFASIQQAPNIEEDIKGFQAEEYVEKPPMTEERFRDIETRRLAGICGFSAHTEWKYRRFFNWFDRFVESIEEPVLLVLIPDEFQVNDRLFRTLTDSLEESEWDPFRPQKEFKNYCDSMARDCLDLTEALRAAEKKGPTYHVRDTHWNIRGNKVVGLALAQQIRPYLVKFDQ